MSLSLEFEKEDSKILLILWEGNLWRKVYKSLFFSDLSLLPRQLEWGEFLNRFKLLEDKVAKKQAIVLLSKRAYLSSALESKLLSKGLSAQASKTAIQYCQEKGFLNDTTEIARLIAKEQKKGLGSKAIYFKLKQAKKIDEHQLKYGLEHTEVSERQALEKWLQKNSRKIPHNDPLEMKKLMAKLIRRGFSAELVFSALKFSN